MKKAIIILSFIISIGYVNKANAQVHVDVNVNPQPVYVDPHAPVYVNPHTVYVAPQHNVYIAPEHSGVYIAPEHSVYVNPHNDYSNPYSGRSHGNNYATYGRHRNSH